VQPKQTYENQNVSERLKAASSERFKSGHFEVERLIAEAGSDGDQLKMSQQQSIVTLWQHGWSFRRIARELQLRREFDCSTRARKPSNSLP